MKRLTKAEKLIRGTFDPSKIRPVLTSNPLLAIPDPMTKLSSVEMEYYRLCAEIMISNHTLTSADIPGLTRAAAMFAIFEQAKQDIAIHGCYQTTQSGYTAKNGYFQVLCDAEKMLTSFERGQGLNLVSRSKLPPPPDPKIPNSFDDI
ncbi:MAG: P27 family phage terminase small subunit [Bacteroidales bacterium]